MLKLYKMFLSVGQDPQEIALYMLIFNCLKEELKDIKDEDIELLGKSCYDVILTIGDPSIIPGVTHNIAAYYTSNKKRPSFPDLLKEHCQSMVKVA